MYQDAKLAKVTFTPSPASRPGALLLGVPKHHQETVGDEVFQALSLRLIQWVWGKGLGLCTLQAPAPVGGLQTARGERQSGQEKASPGVAWGLGEARPHPQPHSGPVFKEEVPSSPENKS